MHNPALWLFPTHRSGAISDCAADAPQRPNSSAVGAVMASRNSAVPKAQYTIQVLARGQLVAELGQAL